MDYAKKEVEVIEQAIAQAEQNIVDLNELQLSLVGGGCGEITPY